MKIILRIIPALALSLAFTGLAHAAPDKAKLKTEVAAMGDAFCTMAKEQGLLAAFQHFAAPDVAFIDTDPRKWSGPAAVLQRIGPDQPGVSLTWSALFTDVSDDGTLGYNYGRYALKVTKPDGKEQTGSGFFLTIWKRQPDGSWRYVMDTGAPDPAPKPKAATPPPETKPAGN